MNPHIKSGAAEPRKKPVLPRLAPPPAWAKRLEGRSIKIIGLGGIGTWAA
jgi:hypothetical protein